MMDSLARSRALWNRARFVLESDEVIAQILDRGELAAWRDLYQMARVDPRLRARIRRIVLTVPVALPHFCDQVYGQHFRQRVKGMGIDEVLTAPQSPWQNPFAVLAGGSTTFGRRQRHSAQWICAVCPAQNGARSSRFKTLPGPDFGSGSLRSSICLGTL